jgi:COPII coat assembly protein SEC16
LSDQASSYGSQSYMPMAGSSYHPLGQSPPSNRHQSTPPQTSYMQNGSLEGSPQRLYRPQKPESYVPTPPPEESIPSYMPSSLQNPQGPDHETGSNLLPAFPGYTSSQPEFQQAPAPPMEEDQATQPSTQTYGYEPPSDTGYVPYEPGPDSDDEKRSDPPRKKSFVDDDDDDFPRVTPAAASTSPVPNPADDAAARRRAADEAAEAAFKAAAAADAERDKDKGSKTVKPKASGWLAGWLPGKKSDSLGASSSEGKEGEKKAIKAKLGEESSFYYDKELKRWVNKKDPNSMQAGAKAAPPPPKGPVGALRGLTPSASLPNMSGPPGRTRTPDDTPAMATPALNGPSKTEPIGPPVGSRLSSGAGTPPNGLAGLGLAPPPRPSTATSNASSIDDLLGPPNAGGRKSVRGAKGKGKGRYVDLVAAKQVHE